MRLSIRIDKRENSLRIINILIVIFLITKMLRGLTVSETAGGIWNYIQLLIILLGTFSFLLNSAECISQKSIKVFLLYTVFAFATAFISLRIINRSSVYSFVMILYPGALLCLYYRLCLDCECRNMWVLKATFCIIAFLFIRYQTNYYSFGGEKAQVSNAYYVLALMPLVVACTNKRYKFLYFAICFLTIAVSSKRAGLIAFALAIILYFFILSVQRRNVATFLRYLVITSIILFVSYKVLSILDQSYRIGFISRLLNLIEDGGSGRMDRWKAVLNAEKSSGLLRILVGHGHGSLSTTLGNAHNDFLQLLYEKGIFTAAIYIAYSVSQFITLASMAREGYAHAADFGMSVIIFLTLAMFSFYIVEGTYITCGMLCQGYFLADWNKQKTRKVIGDETHEANI